MRNTRRYELDLVVLSVGAPTMWLNRCFSAAFMDFLRSDKSWPSPGEGGLGEIEDCGELEDKGERTEGMRTKRRENCTELMTGGSRGQHRPPAAPARRGSVFRPPNTLLAHAS